MANFIPPANGTSQGNYFLPKSHKLAVLEEKNKKQLWQLKVQAFFNGFWFWLDEKSNKDRQTNSGFFLSVKFTTSLLTSLAGG